MKGRFPFLREVRGFGLMVGAELDRPGKGVVERAMAKGLLMNCTHDTVLRFLPALTVTQAEIDEGMDILEESLAEE